jgi:hypothetical protein
VKNQRKVYLINPDFQLKITGYFILLAVINIAVFYGCVYYFFDIFQSKGIEIGLPKNHVFFMFIEDQMTQMNSVFIIMAILTAVILLIAGVLISHRIAGPMYRLNQDLRMMAEKKELRSLRFRKKDFFQEIPDAFNMVVDSLNKRNE